VRLIGKLSMACSGSDKQHTEMLDNGIIWQIVYINRRNDRDLMALESTNRVKPSCFVIETLKMDERSKILVHLRREPHQITVKIILTPDLVFSLGLIEKNTN
jgi:hypothetical protein